MSVIDAFVGHLRHELRTPVNAIIGYGQLLLEEHGSSLSADARSDLERVTEAGQQMLRVVVEALDPVDDHVRRALAALEPPRGHHQRFRAHRQPEAVVNRWGDDQVDRPELVLKSGIPAWGASGDGNATTMLAEPVTVRRQVGAQGTAAARLSLAFLAREAMDAELPISRPRAQVRDTRELTADAMVRNARRGAVRVDPRSYAVTLDGEPVHAPPVERVAFSDRFLLG